jgi:hypothetical protein
MDGENTNPQNVDNVASGDVDSTQVEATQETAEAPQEQATQPQEGVNQEANAPQGGYRELAQRQKEDLAFKQYQQQQTQAYTDPQAAQYNNTAAYQDPNYMTLAEIQNLKQNQTRIEERLKFSEAERIFPELDPKSASYDMDFDDLVTAQYKVRSQYEDVDPASVAKDVKSYLDSKLESIKNQARKEAEQGIADKSMVGNSDNRSDAANASQKPSQAEQTFRKTGNLNDLYATLMERSRR